MIELAVCCKRSYVVICQASLKRGHPQRVHHVGLVRLEQGEVDEELVLHRSGVFRREPGKTGDNIHGFQRYVLCWNAWLWEFCISALEVLCRVLCRVGLVVVDLP